MNFDLEDLVIRLMKLRTSVNNMLMEIKSFYPVNVKIPKLKDPGFRLVLLAESRLPEEGPPVPGGEDVQARERGSKAKVSHGVDLAGLVAWEAIEKYLLTRGKPALTTEIASALLQHGFRSSSNNFRGFVYQVLRKKPSVFSRVDRGLWALKRWNQP